MFFRAQEIDLEQQKTLGRKLGELSGKPDTSGLHIHPLTRDVCFFPFLGRMGLIESSLRSLEIISLLLPRRGRRGVIISGGRIDHTLRALVG